jgi:ABC-2 type transport system ATP-binding protein
MNLRKPAIEVVELTKNFGEFVAVNHVTFSVEEGEIFGWLGPNGAGKTTTIRMLLGLIKPTSGAMSVLGYDPVRETKTMQAQVGYMSQQFTLYNELTARENIRFYGRVYGLSPAELNQREEELLQMAGLAGRANVITGSLSGGWKQRLALGCAIVHRPRVVFLDEPTAGVDPISRREFWELIYSMAKQGVTILVTTHYMDEAELCQRVGFISQGNLVALDSPARLKQTRMRGRVLEINTPAPDRAMSALKTAQQERSLPLEEVALYGAQIHAVIPGLESNRDLIRLLLEARDVPITALEWIEPSLEDVFISAVGEIGKDEL